MKFSLKDSTSFGWDGLKARAYNSKEQFENASAAVFEVTKEHGKVLTELSDRVYYVVEGEGKFVINGKEEKVIKTDVVIVPKNTPYNYMAINGKTLKLFLVHTPAYDPEMEKKLED